ncbi:MAG: TatD family hydrolase [candidate division WOR-3 bacterium]
MTLFDSHCHLTDTRLLSEVESILVRAEEAGVRYILSCGTDTPDNFKTISLAKRSPLILSGVGFHPHSADEFTEGDLFKIEEILKREKVYCLGEIGLDFYKNYSRKENQIKVFKNLVKVAQKYNLPMSIHSRSAFSETIAVLKEIGYFNGVFHCFSGSWEMAKLILDLGFYISFSGSITYDASRLREVIKKIPEERILIETDAPYLAPVPFRGKRNEPSYLSYILKAIAEIKGLEENKMAEVIMENGKRIFRC